MNWNFLEGRTYHESIQTSRCEYLILSYSIKSWDPAEEGVWKLWEYGSSIFLPLARSVESCPSRSQETKCEESKKAKSNGDDDLGGDVSLVLVVALILVAILGGHHAK